MQTYCLPLLLLLLLLLCSRTASGFGSMGPISASFGEDDSFFCAIDAGGKQQVICWGSKNSSSSSSPPSSTSSSAAGSSSLPSSFIPPMAALSGGEGFMCGILANTSQAYCWTTLSTTTDLLVPSTFSTISTTTDLLVPSTFSTISYSHIAAGKSHVCAIRGPYYSDHDSGNIDCWDIVKTVNNNLTSKPANDLDQSIANINFKNIVSGEEFTCGNIRDGGLICFGPNSNSLGISETASTQNYIVLAAGKNALCGISELSGEVSCWGETKNWEIPPPNGTKFVYLSSGSRHFCGIRGDNHGIECWGSFNSSYIPKGSGFKAIASSEFATCGIREDDLVLDCWSNSFNASPSSVYDYDPPLELCSPGLCSSRTCSFGEFSFNASVLNEPDLTNLCVRKDLRICSPCGTNCSEGFFLSSPCTENGDRVCTPCSLCQNSSCWDACGVKSAPHSEMGRLWHHLRRVAVIIGSSAAALLLVLLGGWCLLQRPLRGDDKEGKGKNQFKSCIGKPDLEAGDQANYSDSHFGHSPQSASVAAAPCPGVAQVFRLSELKDATNGFKEFNELGRGSYGFVYKALLADGRQVAVKRANAATIIHSNSRDFEMELEILCKIRHCNLVNLLGYCSEMGERLLVYEYMPHGTLYDHLHGGLSPLNWSLRLKISVQAAKGLEYLHKEFTPPIVHRDVKTSNILLDSEWGARIADFGLITPSDHKDFSGGGGLESDVQGFGIVLLEILSGRKAYDRDYNPPSIIEWAVPLIKQGKAAAIIDRYMALPRNVEPLLKLADVAELAVRENPSERPCISDIASSLEHIAKDGLIL